MELIRDVANELDIDLLSHKILVNVNILTQADRGSLFLVKRSGNQKFLEAKLFDVTESTGEEAFFTSEFAVTLFHASGLYSYILFCYSQNSKLLLNELLLMP